MVRKYLKKSFCVISLCLMAYLFVVFLWATSVVDELLAQVPARSQATPLQPWHVEVLIKIEDPTFRQHHGLDISKGQGVTTLTSVVARGLFLGNHRLDGLRGAMQSFYRAVFGCCKKVDVGRDVMALVLDANATKQQQLDMFVNGTYFGSLNGKAVVGFEAAAMAYFGKELSGLTDEEFYGIMAMPIAPNRYHPMKNPELHAERVKRIAALVAGRCEAEGWLDLSYRGCATGD